MPVLARTLRVLTRIHGCSHQRKERQQGRTGAVSIYSGREQLESPLLLPTAGLGNTHDPIHKPPSRSIQRRTRQLLPDNGGAECPHRSMDRRLERFTRRTSADGVAECRTPRTTPQLGDAAASSAFEHTSDLTADTLNESPKASLGEQPIEAAGPKLKRATFASQQVIDARLGGM
jgi:hypothetical protein